MASFDTTRLHYDQVSLVSPFHFTPRDVRASYELLGSGSFGGDQLVSGAYALDQASQYNGRPRPAAVMVRESGNVDVIRRRETYEDLYSLDVW